MANVKEAGAKWKETVNDPCAQTKIVRGETCLHVFGGVTVSSEEERGVSKIVKQRMDLRASEDYDNFQEVSGSQIDRAGRVIQADAASSKNSSRAELPASSNLLRVKDDTEAMRAAHAERELAWIESCRAKAEKAGAGGKSGGGQQKIQTLELEKLQFEAGFRKAVQSLRSQ